VAPKDCPACDLVNPPTAQRCDCGYDFIARRFLGTYLTETDVTRAAEDAQARKAQYRVLKWTSGFFGWWP
jgi:hypothetical protein